MTRVPVVDDGPQIPRALRGGRRYGGGVSGKR
jgi:hypothetical protein